MMVTQGREDLVKTAHHSAEDEEEEDEHSVWQEWLFGSEGFTARRCCRRSWVRAPVRSGTFLR
jgi:hypothetical protein